MGHIQAATGKLYKDVESGDAPTNINIAIGKASK